MNKRKSAHNCAGWKAVPEYLLRSIKVKYCWKEAVRWSNFKQSVLVNTLAVQLVANYDRET